MNQKLNRMPTRVASSLIPWAAGGGGDFVEPELHKYIVFTYIHAYRQCMLVYSTVLFSVQLDSFYCFHVFYGPVGASLTPSLAPLSTEIRHIFCPKWNEMFREMFLPYVSLNQSGNSDLFLLHSLCACVYEWQGLYISESKHKYTHTCTFFGYLTYK